MSLAIHISEGKDILLSKIGEKNVHNDKDYIFKIECLFNLGGSTAGWSCLKGFEDLIKSHEESLEI